MPGDSCVIASLQQQSYLRLDVEKFRIAGVPEQNGAAEGGERKGGIQKEAG